MIRISKHKKQIMLRLKMIEFIYTCYCLYDKINLTFAFESFEYNENEIKIIEFINKKEHLIINICKLFLKPTWSWSRIDILTKAFLIYGTFELLISSKKDNQKNNLVINEMVEYSKYWLKEKEYKFINGVLQNVSDFIVKKNQKNQKNV